MNQINRTGGAGRASAESLRLGQELGRARSATQLRTVLTHRLRSWTVIGALMMLLLASGCGSTRGASSDSPAAVAQARKICAAGHRALKEAAKEKLRARREAGVAPTDHRFHALLRIFVESAEAINPALERFAAIAQSSGSPGLRFLAPRLREGYRLQREAFETALKGGEQAATPLIRASIENTFEIRTVAQRLGLVSCMPDTSTTAP
jgi:hypothetical protein